MKSPVSFFSSLRFRLLLASMCVEVLLLALLVGNSFRLVDEAMRASSMASLEQMSPMLNIAAGPSLVQGDYATLRDNLTEIVGNGHGAVPYVLVYDRGLRRIAWAGAVNPEQPPNITADLDVISSDGVLHVERPLLLAGEEIGRIRFGLSTALIAEARENVLRQGGAIAAVEIGLTFLALGLIGFWLTSRLNDFIVRSQAVASGNYQGRLNESGRDEVARLAQTFNRMTDAVQLQMAEVRATGHEYQALFDQAAVGMAHISMQGEWLRVNDKGLSLLGYANREALFAVPTLERIHPDDRAEALQSRNELLSGRRSYVVAERRYLKADGSYFWALVTISLYRNEAGVPLYFAVIVQDLTEQKATASALELGEVRYKRLIESMRVIPWEYYPDGQRMAYIGPQIETLVGISSNQWLDNGGLRACIHPDDWLAFSLALGAEQADLECRLRGNHDQWIWVGCSMAQVAASDGRMVVQGYFLDIRDRKTADAELEQYRNHLEDRVRDRTQQLMAMNRELESFSYSVSHDLRAPLRAIDGYAGMLKEDYAESLDEKGRDYLSRIHGAVERMAGLIEALLGLARVTRGELNTQTLDLAALSATVLDDIRAAHPGRSISAHIEPGLFCVADRKLMSVVMQNLLNNAVKYSSRQQEVRIEVGVEEQNGERVFYVRDFGVGFDPQYSERLFGVFQRLHSAQEFEGTGVGLATCQRIIHRHGGRIWASSMLGQGATFYFTLGKSQEGGLSE